MGKKLVIFSWALYDFANTIFSMNIISLYFALWVTVQMKGEDLFYSLALTGSMLISAIFEPIFGALSDSHKTKRPFLIFFTIVCCLFTGFLTKVRSLFIGLVFFAIANFGYQLASIFYNALLGYICDKERVGRISGYGVSLGYIGTILGLLMVRPFVLKGGYQAAFLPTAILFLLFSLPCFFLVKEEAQQSITPVFNLKVKEAFFRIKQMYYELRRYPVLKNFLLACLLFLGAINTVIIFMSVYTKKVMGFSESELINFYLISTVFAILGAFIFGFITDKIGSRKSVDISLKIWLFALILALLITKKELFWFVGPVVGVALGSVWVSTRALAIHLCPKERLGEFFGILGLTGKSASIFGPLIWGLVVLVFGFLGMLKYRLAILAQLTLMLSGYAFFKKIKEKDIY